MRRAVNSHPLSRQVAWLVSLCVVVAAGCGSGGPSGFEGAGGAGGGGSGSSGGSLGGGSSGGGGGGGSGSGSGGTGGSSGSSSGLGDAGSSGADGGGLLLGDGGTVNTGTTACATAGSARTTSGCDYFVVQPDVIFEGAGACFAAFLANTSAVPVHIGVAYGTHWLDVTKFAYIPVGTGTSLKYSPLANGVLGPGQVTILFLSKYDQGFPSLPPLNYNCPAGVTPAITSLDPAPHGTSLGTAFHITTDGPIVAYDEYPYGGGQSAMTSATLLLPVSSWDTNYVAVDGFAASQLSGGLAFIDVVGEQDGTTVTIKPSAAIAAGKGVAGAAQGTPTTYTVNRGQVLQFTQSAELGGSILQSSRPVGVWGGHTGLNVGTNDCCADGAHQQIPPVRALGSEYVGVRYRDRYAGTDESPPWRLVGAADGTTLTYDPAPPTGAPTTLSLGQVVAFETGAPFVVSSQDAQHPFYMSGHMTGAGPYDPNQTDGRGDPEFVNVIPPGEFLSSYIFFTDPTYPETNLVLTRARGPNGFADVTLDCAGPLTGWTPVGSGGQYEYTRIDLSTGNFQGQNGCNNGRHGITSAAPFGLTVWAWGSAATGSGLTGFYTQYVSYAYPAGQSIAPINVVVVPPTAQ